MKRRTHDSDRGASFVEYGAVIVLISLIVAVLFLSGIPGQIRDGIGGAADGALSGETAPPGAGGGSVPEGEGSSDEDAAGGGPGPSGGGPLGENQPGADDAGTGDGTEEVEGGSDSDGFSGDLGFDSPPLGADEGEGTNLPGLGSGDDASSSDEPSLIEQWWNQTDEEESDSESELKTDSASGIDADREGADVEVDDSSGECGWLMPEVCSIGGGLIEGGKDVTENLGADTCWFGVCDDEETTDSGEGVSGGSGESSEGSGDAVDDTKDDSPDGQSDDGTEVGVSGATEEASENAFLRVLVAILRPFRFLGA